MTQNTGPNIQGSVVIDDNFRKVLDNLKSFEKGMQRASNQLTQASNNVTSAVRAMGVSMSGNSRAVDGLTTSQDRATQSQERMERAVRMTDSVLAANTRAITTAEVSYQRLEARVRASALSDTEKTNTLTRARAALDAATGSINTYTSRSNEAATAVGRFKKELTDANIVAARANREFRGQEITDLKNNFRELGASAALALGPLNGVASRLIVLRGILNRNTISVTALIGSFTAFTVALSSSISVATEAETTFLRIESTLNSMGFRAKATAEEIMELGHSVALATLTSTQEARQGALVLAGFSNIATDSFERILITAQGMSEQLGGNLVDNTKALARAIDDPVRRFSLLERQIGSVNKAAADNIRTLAAQGDSLGATNAILDLLSDRYDLAIAGAGGLAGALDTVGETITRFRERALLAGGGIETAKEKAKEFTKILEDLEEGGAIERVGNAFERAISVIGSAINFLVTRFEVIVGLIAILSGSAIVKLVTMFGRLASTMVIGRTAATAMATAIGTKGLLGGVVALTTALSVMNPWMLALRVGMIALGPVLGLVGMRFLTSGNSAEEATPDIIKYKDAMEGVLRTAQQLRDFDTRLDGLSADLRDVNTEAFSVADKISMVRSEIEGLTNASIENRLRNMARWFDGLDSSSEDFESQVFQLARAVGHLREQSGPLTAAQQKLVDSFELATGASGDTIIQLARLQLQYEELNAEMNKLMGIGEGLGSTISANSEAAAAQLEIFDRLSKSVTDLSDTYDRQHTAIQTLENDYLKLKEDLVAANELLENSVHMDEEKVASVRSYIEAIERMLKVNREQLNSMSNVNDKADTLGSSYRALVRNIKAVEDETRILRALYNDGEDISMLIAIEQHMERITDDIREFNDLELRSLAERIGFEDFESGGMDGLLGAYEKWYTAERKAQQSTEDLLAAQQRLNDFLYTSTEYADLVASYEAAIVDAKKLGNDEAIVELEKRMAQEAALMEREATKMAQFSVSMTARQIEEEREERALRLAEMYDAESEMFKQHLENMNRQAKQAQVFSNFLVGAEMAQEGVSAIMSTMESMNRAQGESYKRMARMQAGIAAALGIAKIWEAHSANPIYASGLTALASAQFGAQMAAINAAKFNQGGFVSGKGGPRDDRIPAWLSNGEFVMNARSVSQIGLDNLEMMNQGRMPKFSQGGAVMPIATPAMGGGSNVMVQVIDQRSGDSSAPIETEEFLSPDGQQTIRVIVRDMVRQEINGGGVDRQMNQSYGLQRRPKKR